MIEKIIERNGEAVTEVRSDGGKLLFIKTKYGYEMKCPRTKQICLVRYEEMMSDCLGCLNDAGIASATGTGIGEILKLFKNQKGRP